MSIKQIKSLVQFARGTSLIFDSLTTPIPDGVVVFAIDNGAFKLGDGATLYANLPILFKYEDLLGAQGGISNLFKTISAADNGKIVVAELDVATSTVKYAVSNTTLASLLASISALEAVNTTQDADIAGVLATALSIDVSINTGMDNNVIVINSGRYMNSGTSIASIQAQVAAQSTNQPGSHLDEPVFYTTSDKKKVVDRLSLFDDNTYYVDVIGYNNSVPTPVFGITCSNTNVTITSVAGSLFSVKFNGITNTLKTDIPVILTLSIDNGLGTSTVRKAVVCKVQRQRIMTAIYWLSASTLNDVFSGAVTDNKGNIFVVGYVKSEGLGNEEALIVKFDTNLNILARKVYGGTGKDMFLNVALDSNNNVYCVGWTGSEGAGNTDGLFLKFDENLNLLIRKRYGGSGAEEFYDIAVDSQNNIYCVGNTRSEGAGSNDAIVVKFDTNLNILARKVYGGTGIEIFNGVAVDPDNNVICIGSTDTSTLAGTDALVVKFDSSLTILATKRYGGSNDDKFTGVAVDSNGNIICVGLTESVATFINCMLFTKFDNNLNILSSKYYGFSTRVDACNVHVDSQNNIICVGNNTAEGAGVKDCFVVKFDNNFNALGKKVYGSNINNEMFLNATTDSGNNIICVGTMASTAFRNALNGVILKLPSAIPTGTFSGTVITNSLIDSNLALGDISGFNLNNAALTLVNSNLTLADSALTLQVSTLTLEKDYLN